MLSQECVDGILPEWEVSRLEAKLCGASRCLGLLALVVLVGRSRSDAEDVEGRVAGLAAAP
eukprot:1397186-Rhodomonas_salina.3